MEIFETAYAVDYVALPYSRIPEHSHREKENGETKTKTLSKIRGKEEKEGLCRCQLNNGAFASILHPSPGSGARSATFPILAPNVPPAPLALAYMTCMKGGGRGRLHAVLV